MATGVNVEAAYKITPTSQKSNQIIQFLGSWIITMELYGNWKTQRDKFLIMLFC
jgi:hypothetical protein